MPIIYIAIAIALSVGSFASASAAQPEHNSADTQVQTQSTPTEPSDKERFQKDVVEKKDLPNFHEVHPYLFRSGAPTELGMQDAHDQGIKTIIDLRSQGEKKFNEALKAKALGIKYITMPMSSEAPTKKQVDVFMKTIKQAQEHPQDGAVLVHCAHGSDRTGCMVGIWRVRQDGWNYEQTYKEMRKYWFGPKFTKLSGAVQQRAAH